MTKDQINARLAEREAELRQVKADLKNSGTGLPLPLDPLEEREKELQVEIVALQAMLDEL